MRKFKVHTGAFAVVAALMLVLAPVSFGENSSVGTYGGSGGSVAGSVASGSAGSGPGSAASPTATASSSSGLPFTGFDVALLAGGGLLLVLGGFAMARMVARSESEPADSGL
jgi:hypothetical protein